jgi:hypothetical protein
MNSPLVGWTFFPECARAISKAFCLAVSLAMRS